MKQRDKLRDALRGHYDQQEFAFGQGDWEKAAALIASKQRRKKMLWLCCILLVTGAGMLLLLPLAKAPAGELAIQQVKKPSSIESHTLVTENNIPNAKTQDIIKSAGLVKNTSGGMSLTETNSPANNTPPVLLRGQVKPALQDEHLESGENMPGQIQAVSQTKTGKELVAALESTPPDNRVAVESPAAVSTADLPPAISFSPADAEAPGELNKNLDHSENINPKENDKNPPGIQSLRAVKTNLSQATEGPTEEPSGKKEELVQTDIRDMGDSTLLNQQAVSVDSTKIPTSQLMTEGSTDSTFYSRLATEPGREGLYLEAGGNWNYGWRSGGVKEADGFSPTAGITYLSTMGTKTAFSTGLIFNQVSGLSSSTITSRVSTYGYGEMTDVTSISPASLQYLCLPLRLHLFVSNKHSIGGALLLSYLMNVQTNVTSYRLVPGGTEDYKNYSQGGYMQGFRWYDNQVAVFYRLQVKKQFSLHAEIFMGITDVKNDDFFGQNGKEKNSGLRMVLLYRLSRK